MSAEWFYRVTKAYGALRILVSYTALCELLLLRTLIVKNKKNLMQLPELLYEPEGGRGLHLQNFLFFLQI